MAFITNNLRARLHGENEIIKKSKLRTGMSPVSASDKLYSTWMSFYSRLDLLPGWSDWIVLFIYAALLITISAFHEPWYDEAQAWLIARDTSLYDLIFVTPHYEAHPSLWHLWLALFAKTGVPYEIGLKAAAILLNVPAIAIFLRKSPFHRIFKWAVPFTYFFFYQYGVISRCYSITILGFVLLAVFWRERNNSPYKTVLALALICASAAYAIVLCAGICIVWLFEILKERNGFKRLFFDKRFYALALLTIFVAFITYRIIPYADTLNTTFKAQTSIGMRLFYMFFNAPLDSLFCNSTIFDISIKNHIFSWTAMSLYAVLFLIFAFIVGNYAKNKKESALLIVPYILFSVFSACVYFTSHLLGMETLFFVFWLWICAEDKDTHFQLPGFVLVRIDKNQAAKIKMICVLTLTLLTMIPVCWSVSSGISEIGTNYDAGRDSAEYLKSSGLLNCDKIGTIWVFGHIKRNDRVVSDFDNPQLAEQWSAIEVNPYFDHNIFYTMDSVNKGVSYSISRYCDETTTHKLLSEISEKGLPDVIIENFDFKNVFQDVDPYTSYAEVQAIRYGTIFKGIGLPCYCRIYVRRDLLQKYGLTEITDDEVSFITVGSTE